MVDLGSICPPSIPPYVPTSLPPYLLWYLPIPRYLVERRGFQTICAPTHSRYLSTSISTRYLALPCHPSIFDRTFRHSPFTTPTTHHSPLTPHPSPLTHYSPFTTSFPEYSFPGWDLFLGTVPTYSAACEPAPTQLHLVAPLPGLLHNCLTAITSRPHCHTCPSEHSTSLYSHSISNTISQSCIENPFPSRSASSRTLLEVLYVWTACGRSSSRATVDHTIPYHTIPSNHISSCFGVFSTPQQPHFFDLHQLPSKLDTSALSKCLTPKSSFILSAETCVSLTIQFFITSVQRRIMVSPTCFPCTSSILIKSK